MPSSRDLVRTLIQDGTEPYLISDGDIDAIVALEENAYRAAATAARAISGKFGERADMGAGSSKMALSQQASAFLRLAESLDKRAQTGGDGGTGLAGYPISGPSVTGVNVDTMESERDDADRYPSSFRRGLMDNPEEGSDE